MSLDTYGQLDDDGLYSIGEVPLLITIDSRTVASVARARSKASRSCASHNLEFEPDSRKCEKSSFPKEKDSS